MKLREFTSETNEDGSQIVRVRSRVSDHADRDEQSEWIELQLAVDVQTIRNGAILRQEVLEKARDALVLVGNDMRRTEQPLLGQTRSALHYQKKPLPTGSRLHMAMNGPSELAVRMSAFGRKADLRSQRPLFRRLRPLQP